MQRDESRWSIRGLGSTTGHYDFEGIDSERGIAWRAADSLAVRSFVRLALNEAAPDHSTISRTRRLIDVETHRAAPAETVTAHLAYSALI